MFNPNTLISPVSAVLDILKRQNGGFYSLLLTDSNVEFVTIEATAPPYNTRVMCNERNTAGEVTKLGRLIEYNRISLSELIIANSQLVTQRDSSKAYHMIDPALLATNYHPNHADVTLLLNTQYGLPINVYDLAGYDTIVTTPVSNADSAPVGLTPSRLINATVEDSLYTYIGGSVPSNNDSDYTLMGMHIYRKQYSQETLNISLPFAREREIWTVCFEGVTTDEPTERGVRWFSLTLNTYHHVWTLHIDGRLPVKYKASDEALLTIDKFDDVIAIIGQDLKGLPQTQIIFSTPDMLHQPIQRVSVTTTNPYPQILQFKMGTDALADTEVKPLYIAAHEMSNAITGGLTYPLVLTDTTCVNYVEDTTNRYIQPRGTLKTTGHVIKYTQLNEALDAHFDMVVNDFINICLSGNLKRMVFTVNNLTHTHLSIRVEYRILSVNVEDRTIQVVIVSNNIASPVQTFKLYDLSGVIRIKITPYLTTVSSSYHELGRYYNTGVSVGLQRFSVKYEMELHTANDMPALSFSKATTATIITETPL